MPERLCTSPVLGAVSCYLELCKSPTRLQQCRTSTMRLAAAEVTGVEDQGLPLLWCPGGGFNVLRGKRLFSLTGSSALPGEATIGLRSVPSSLRLQPLTLAGPGQSQTRENLEQRYGLPSTSLPFAQLPLLNKAQRSSRAGAGSPVASAMRGQSLHCTRPFPEQMLWAQIPLVFLCFGPDAPLFGHLDP